MGFAFHESKSTDRPSRGDRHQTLTKEQLKKIFMGYDINYDNNLSRKELKQAFDKLGAFFPDYRAARGLSHADAKNDGQIDMDELEDLVNYAYELGYIV